MNGLAGYQEAFARALYAADADAAPPGLDAADRHRFRVYRNNVFHGLTEALAAAYPAVHRLVGDAFFRAMGRHFLLAHPPRSRSLALFGEAFPAFVAGFAPARCVAYLADVARLERAVLEATHAADHAPLDPAGLTGRASTAPLAFAPHPAARLVPSPHPVVALWRAQIEGKGALEIIGRAETALVTRPHGRVLVQPLSPAQGAFAAALLAGATAETAVEHACLIDREFVPVSGFEPLLAGGALAELRTGERP